MAGADMAAPSRARPATARRQRLLQMGAHGGHGALLGRAARQAGECRIASPWPMVRRRAHPQSRSASEAKWSNSHTALPSSRASQRLHPGGSGRAHVAQGHWGRRTGCPGRIRAASCCVAASAWRRVRARSSPPRRYGRRPGHVGQVCSRRWSATFDAGPQGGSRSAGSAARPPSSGRRKWGHEAGGVAFHQVQPGRPASLQVAPGLGQMRFGLPPARPMRESQMASEARRRK